MKSAGLKHILLTLTLTETLTLTLTLWNESSAIKMNPTLKYKITGNSLCNFR